MQVSEHLAEDGAIAKYLDGFTVRSQQQQMADRISSALLDREILVCEAGTGTGKTLAYLIPALLSGLKVIVSTGTRNLQDQLFHRDLPLVKEALSVPVNIALLKGRANYLCPYRLSISQDVLLEKKSLAHLARIKEWANFTDSGDIAEVTAVPENSEVWRWVTSTTDNCLGQKCPELSECHVIKARRAAMEADLIVVNHHLFFADLALRDEGFGELLPGVDAVILDEAHQVPEIATTFFGTNLTARQLRDLAEDARAAWMTEASDTSGVKEVIDHFEYCIRQFRLVLGNENNSQKGIWSRVSKRAQVKDTLETLTSSVEKLNQILDAIAERGPELANCLRRCEDFYQRLMLLTTDDDEQYLRWFELRGNGFALHLTPLDVGEVFSEYLLQGERAWVFTSATLAVGQQFAHFTERMGLENCETAYWDSPFDYQKQALCYLPEGLPEPSNSAYNPKVLQAVLPVLNASQGRAFILFTSYRSLQWMAENLPERVDYPVFVQGEKSRSQLLEEFRNTDNAILLATSSFWEGVDVRGERLSCVIIDKLPFSSPDDPVLQARCDRVRKNAGNPFMQIQVPQAVISLKQGAGRLIRDTNDTGLLMLCDPRLRTKSYGRIFLQSLPKTCFTNQQQDVENFFSSLSNQEECIACQ